MVKSEYLIFPPDFLILNVVMFMVQMYRSFWSTEVKSLLAELQSSGICVGLFALIPDRI